MGPWTQVSGTVWRAPIPSNVWKDLYGNLHSPIGIVVNEVPLRQVTQGQRGSTAVQVGLAGVTSGSGKWHNGGNGGFITADFGTTIGSGDPNLADIVVPSDDGYQYHIFFYDAKYLTIKGITTRGSGNAGIWGYGRNITIDSVNVKFNGKQAISFQPLTNNPSTNSDNSVLYSHVYHNALNNWPRGNNGFAEAGGGWGGGVGWSTQLRPLARGNIVHMNGGEGIITYGSNKNLQSGSALFEQNVSYDNWSVNMYFDNQPNDVARNNILFNHPADPANFLANTGSAYETLDKSSTCLMLADEQGSSDFIILDPRTNQPYYLSSMSIAEGGFGLTPFDPNDPTGIPYSKSANLDNSKVYNNIMAGCRIGIRDYSEGNDGRENSARATHGLKNTLIANNTIIMPSVPYSMASFGIHIQDNKTCPTGVGGGAACPNVDHNINTVIQNNLIIAPTDIGYDSDNAALVWSELGQLSPGINLDYNNYYAPINVTKPFRVGFNSAVRLNFSSWKATIVGSETHSSYVDPSLVNVSSFGESVTASPLYFYGNANLSSGSPLIGAGAAQSFVPANNFTGQVRSIWNIGAF